MPTAAETIAAITNILPRSQEVVERIATPRTVRETAARRRFRVWMLGLVATFFLVVLLAPSPFSFSGGGILGGLIAIWGVVWFATTQRFGNANAIVRSGVAYPARVEERHGGARSRIGFVVTWTDGNGREGRRVLPQVSGAPEWGKEAVVLALPQWQVVGILVGDFLYVS